MFRITRLLFATTSTSCSSYPTTFSSYMSFCTIYASTKWCSSTLSSSNSSMHTGSINIAPGFVCSFAHQRHLLLRKNSTAYVLIVLMSWIIIYAIISSNYMPSLLHISKMMMNAVATLHPTTEYSTFLLFLLFSTPLLLMLFSTLSLSPPAFIYAHSSTLPFPLLFAIVFQLHSLHSYCCELQNFENAHNFQQQTQIVFDSYSVFFPQTSYCYIHFFIFPPSIN